jgi:hypothetical protein
MEDVFFRACGSVTRGVAFAAGLLASAAALAAPVAYTDRAAFDAAIAGMHRSVENFDAMAPGTLIASGDALGGLALTYDLDGVSLAVTDGMAFGGGVLPFATTSPANFLGTDDGDMFQDGDGFTVQLGGVNAFGLYLISADRLWDGDFLLSAGGIGASLWTGDLQAYFPGDGGSVYFLGIVDADAPLWAATLATDHDMATGQFLWNADDLVVARASQVPEPASLGLFAVGLAALTARRRHTLSTT